MNVVTTWQSRADQPLKSPFPVRDGFFFALRRGDIYSPDSWSSPTFVRRDRALIPRPFLSWRKGSAGFYIGWKAFGADLERYKAFPCTRPEDIGLDSAALQGFTWRFSNAVGAA